MDKKYQKESSSNELSNLSDNLSEKTTDNKNNPTDLVNENPDELLEGESYNHYGIRICGKVGASINTLPIYLKKVFQRERGRQVEEKKSQGESYQKACKEVHNLEAAIAQQKNDHDASEKLIEEYDAQLSHIQQATEKYNENETQIKRAIGITILILLTLYLFVFYTSTFYSAFFISPEDATEYGLAKAMFNGQAILQALGDGLIELLFILCVPIFFLGLGATLHFFATQKGWSKYVKIVAVLIVTFIFNCIPAYNIAKLLDDVKDLNAYNSNRDAYLSVYRGKWKELAAKYREYTGRNLVLGLYSAKQMREFGRRLDISRNRSFDKMTPQQQEELIRISEQINNAAFFLREAFTNLSTTDSINLQIYDEIIYDGTYNPQATYGIGKQAAEQMKGLFADNQAQYVQIKFDDAEQYNSVLATLKQDDDKMYNIKTVRGERLIRIYNGNTPGVFVVADIIHCGDYDINVAAFDSKGNEVSPSGIGKIFHRTAEQYLMDLANTYDRAAKWRGNISKRNIAKIVLSKKNNEVSKSDIVSPFNINKSIITSQQFWTIIACGFLVYIIWCIAFDMAWAAQKEIDTNETLGYKRNRISQSKRNESKKLIAIKNKIAELEGQLKNETILLSQSVQIDYTPIKIALSDFIEGWMKTMAVLDCSEEQKKEAKAAHATFVANLDK